MPVTKQSGAKIVKEPKPGCRVKVPFGKRELIGLVLGYSNNSDIASERLKPIIEIIDSEPILDTHTLDLYLWASNYYQFPIGQALQTSLPKYVREGRPLNAPREKHWRLTSSATQTGITSLSRAPQQQRLFELIKTYQHLSTDEASTLLNAPAQKFLSSLEDKNLLESFLEPEKTSATSKLNTAAPSQQLANFYGNDQPLTLNQEQESALKQVLAKLSKFHPFLLEGITGSGKTEIYLQLIAEVLQNGQQVLVLVPEINLTPQTIKRFENRFNQTVVALHSGLNDSQRFQSWLKAKEGRANIIIGTRSAIFTPMTKLGLIIIDEEHDNSYKQQEGFRYNARDLAIYRARLQSIPVLLGTATPALESLSNALKSRYTLLQLSQRAGHAKMPTFRFIDLKEQKLEEGFSPVLLEAIQAHLAKGKQVLVFINRRGYSPLLQCYSCGWIAICPRCETGYTLHQQPPGLRCHHCDSQIRLMPNCPECKAPDLAAIGMGTERSEKVLSQYFNNTPVLRIDRDSTRNKNALNQMLETINSGKPCLLVGTQMLAKGHHFPDVTLVAVLDADSGLFSADFRGQEQMGQLLIQVAGRAGRGDSPGEVLIQTYHSTHPALVSLIENGYGNFARQLLKERQQSGLPPYSHLILFRAEASDRNLPESFLNQLSNLCQQHKAPFVTILGPMPAPMEKRAGRFRVQLLLQSKQRADLHKLSQLLINAIDKQGFGRKVRWSVDIDPIDFT